MDEKEIAFEKLMTDNPAEALKYVKEFQGTVFWKYLDRKLEKEASDLLMMLYNCRAEEIDRIRGKIEATAAIKAMPQATINDLKDEIALIKEAQLVEEARNN